MKTKILFLLLLGTCIIYGQQPYYNNVDLTKTGIELRDELATKILETHVNFLSYTPGIWEASRITDEDPNDANSVILIYGYENGTDGDVTNDISRGKNNNGGDNGEWNREHTYARSLGIPNLGLEGPGADAHHLRPSDVQRNSSRSNRKFADGNGNSGTTNQGDWYPGDMWKGDIARMMLYMYVRYGDRALPSNVTVGSINSVDPNMIDTLLEWNAEDPVSRIEINRNNYHNSTDQYAQGNRNPFIDNPNLATQIWGGPAAENIWNNTPSDNEIPSAPTNLTADEIRSNEITISWTEATDNIEVIRYDIFVNGNYVSSAINTNSKIISLSPETTYDIQVFATDLSENNSVGSNTISITTAIASNFLIHENFNDCNTVVNNFISLSELSALDWTCDTNAGLNNSGGYQMNAFSGGSTIPSIDWLISTNPINFNNSDNALLSFYARSEFGNTLLELLVSSDYDGSGNPSNFNWDPMPNVSIPLHPSGNSTSDVNEFSNIDISSLSNMLYIAFRYDTNSGNATRWTIDNFQIEANNTLSSTDEIIDNFEIYPNPSNDGAITIDIPNGNNNKINIYDITGKRIISKQNSKETTQLTNLPQGMLLVEIISSQRSITKKVLIH